MSKLTRYGIVLSLFFSICVMIGFGKNAYAADAVPQKNLLDSSQGTDVILLVDNSRSIWSRQTVRNDAMKAAVNVIVGSDIRIGCVYFAGDVYSTYSLSSVRNEEEYRNTCMKYLDMTDQDPNNIDTNIGKGLEGAIALFDSDSNRRKVVVLLSDGINENSSDDPKYKQNANKLTSDLAEKLYDEHIELHCISINGRHDEEYLKQLVNYFRSTDEYDYRFTSIAPDDIAELYDEFTKKFYNFRGDIKYNTAVPDSNGSCTFSVPQLAVKRLQIYIRGKDILPVLKCTSAEAEVKKWELEQSTFLTVDSPPNGEWILNIISHKKQNVDNAKVIIAYYTDLSALTSIEPENGTDILKGHDAKLKIQFFNGNGQPVNIDTEASVTACVNICRNNGTTDRVNLKIDSREDNAIFSDNFKINDLGEMSVDLNVSYGKNINMDYSFSSVAVVVPHAPETIKKYSNDVIKAEKLKSDAGERYLFKIPLEEYVRDPDSGISELRISDVRQYSDKNIFTARLENERIVIEAENYGSINGTIEFEDSDGMTTKLEIEGSIQDMDQTNIFLAFMGFIILAIISGVSIAVYKKHTQDIDLTNTKQRLHDTINRINTLKNNMNELHEYKNTNLDNYRKVKKAWDDFCENSGVTGDTKKYMDNILFSDIKLFDDIESRINSLNNKIKTHNDALKTKLATIKEQEKTLEPEKLKGCSNDHINKLLDDTDKLINDDTLKDSNSDINTNDIDKDIAKLKNLTEAMENKMEFYKQNAIPCAIRVFQNDQRYFKSKPKKDSCKWLSIFDDFTSLDRRTAREHSGKNNIYFMSDEKEISFKNKAGKEEKKMIPVVRVIHIKSSDNTSDKIEYESEIMNINESKNLYGIKIELEE